MTLLHHAVNGNTDERALEASNGRPPATGGERLHPLAEGGGAAEAPPAMEPPAVELAHTFSLDQRLPVIQSALELAKGKLWMPEVRMCTPRACRFQCDDLALVTTSILSLSGLEYCFSRIV